MKKTFYTAGKVWHNSKFQALRAEGFGVKARWIDLDNDSDFVLNQKDKLWNLCFEDVRDADFVLFYAEDFNEERGALVEIGVAYGFGKLFMRWPLQGVAPNEISDVAFTHFANWHWLPTSICVKAQRWLCVLKTQRSDHEGDCMMTKTERKSKAYSFGGFTSGAELRRALKMLKAIQRARQEWKLVRQGDC